MKVYKFSDCFLDPVERRVFKNGHSIQITPRAFDILHLLVESSGKVVSKNELIEKIWPDSFVEEGNIPVHISKLRKLLGANKTEPFIETAAGIGYHFVSRVSAVDENDWQTYLREHVKSSQTKDTDKANLDSIAILPFQHIGVDGCSGDNAEIEYLAEGLTESIINDLSHSREIRVLARNTVFRFKDSPLNAQEIGAQLKVAAVLTGRVKVIRENLVIGVELMNVADGTQLWGKQYNEPFANIFEIQEKIAHSISEILRVQITDLSQKNQNKIPQNIKAYTLYLKGRHFWIKRNVRDTNHAIKYFQESISTEPTYIPSYIGLADCYINLYQLEHISRKQASSLVKTILSRVVEFDENDPETLAMNGYVKLLFEWDWKAAEDCFKKSLSLSPNNTIVRFKYANLLGMKGKYSESLAQLQEALLLDPLSIVLNTTLGRVFYFMEQYDNAIVQLRETLELDPKNYLTLLLLAVSLLGKENYAEALEIFKTVEKYRNGVEVTSMIGMTQALIGDEHEAQKAIEQLEIQSAEKDINPINPAFIYIGLGEIEKAFDCIQKAFDQHSQDLLAIKVDPRLKPIRHDPRFQDLVRRVGLD